MDLDQRFLSIRVGRLPQTMQRLMDNVPKREVNGRNRLLILNNHIFIKLCFITKYLIKHNFSYAYLCIYHTEVLA